MPKPKKCSKCDEEAKHSVTVRQDPHVDAKGKDRSGVVVVRFCEGHWEELKAVLMRDRFA